MQGVLSVMGVGWSRVGKSFAKTIKGCKMRKSTEWCKVLVELPAHTSLIPLAYKALLSGSCLLHTFTRAFISFQLISIFTGAFKASIGVLTIMVTSAIVGHALINICQDENLKFNCWISFLIDWALSLKSIELIVYTNIQPNCKKQCHNE